MVDSAADADPVNGFERAGILIKPRQISDGNVGCTADCDGHDLQVNRPTGLAMDRDTSRNGTVVGNGGLTSCLAVELRT